MKSKLIFCILLALALTLSACKSEKSETTASTETVSATTAASAPAPTAPPAATATIPVAVQPPPPSTPPPGSPAVTGTNVGTSPIVVTQTQVPASPLQAMDSLLAGIPRVSPEEAKQEIDKGQAIIVDVRGPAYQTGHVKGALDIPEAQIPFKMAELPKDKKIITYCT